MILDILLTIGLVLLNGVFVAAEFAIVKVRSSQIELESGTASKRAAKVILGNLDGFLAATQLGITLASLGLGWIGEDVFSTLIFHFMNIFGFEFSEEMSHRIALPIAFALLTVSHIVFGELAPKSLAIRYPTSTTLFLSIPLRIFHIVFRPFIQFLNGFSNLLLHMVGIQPVSEREIHSEEELKLIIAESAEGGAIESGERELIQNVFDFDDRIVKQVMIPRVKISAINVNSTLDDAVHIVFKEGYSRYPVFEGSLDRIIGIVHAKDIAYHHIERTGKPLTEIIHKVHAIKEIKRIDHLLREMQKKKVHMAIVLNESGGTIGIVTLEDILEELVGEIQDEYDHETLVVTRIGDVYHVIANSPLRDINKLLDPPIRESERFETLTGLLQNLSASRLSEGSELIFGGYRMKVLKMSGPQPELIEIKLIEETSSGVPATQ